MQILATCIAPQEYERELRSVSQVCRAWRGLVIGTSRLWANIYIPLSIFLPERRQKIPYMKLYLQRAIDHPLRLTIDPGVMVMRHPLIPPRPFDERTAMGRVIRDIVVPHISRCTAISIQAEFGFSLQEALSALDLTADALETLETSRVFIKSRAPISYFSDESTLFPPRFRAPRLQKMKLCPNDALVRGTTTVSEKFYDQVPMIEELLIGDATGSHSIQDTILDRHIGSATIDMKFIHNRHHSVRVLRLARCRCREDLLESIHLPYLTDLSFDHVEPDSILYFLQHCTAPLLNRLELAFILLHSAWYPLCDNDLLVSRFPLLDSLTLRYVGVSRNQSLTSLESALGNLDFCHSLHIESNHGDRKSTRLNSSHSGESRMPSSA